MLSVKHYIHTRPRLLIAIAAGLGCYFLLPMLPVYLSQFERLMVSWNILAWLYLLMIWLLMMTAAPERIRTIARAQDESASQVLTLVSITCLVSMLVIFMELSTVKQLSGTAKSFHLILTVTTLVASWSLLPTAFSMHYAHLYYRRGAEKQKALLFPDQIEQPEYWDFLYFSFTLAVACQTADVATGTTEVRRITLIQSILAFVFNLAILGLSVNVAAGLMS
ncbi:DUF1345 domain-containing protein [Hafnia psychrotolerans]|uniref:Membrane protein n=1 Tax=Hafnia psychrotolerans TaxID=1477018 RepID=A0ABQ1G0I9_9GAMM|nr:DUF1345 domain-containing protein [Hafnia psychrotolerans]GGA35045.1 membrane protein [Hafnia psychrotolerans]